MPELPTTTPQPKRQLTLYDSTSIIVGIIIGAAIYESSPGIAKNVDGLAGLLGVWTLGAVLSLLGALCYAELANAFPQSGGDYAYVTRAFGHRTGFLFAWAQLWVVRPGSIGAMAYVFARYAYELYALDVGGGPQRAMVAYAAGSVLVLSAVNLLGVREGKWTQNVLTTAKLLGLLAVVAVGFWYVAPAAAPQAAPAAAENSGPSRDFGLALVFVLFAYGGWNEMAYVAAEVREPRKNLLRALLLGTVAVAGIYLAATLAFVHCLGLEGLRDAKAVAAEVLRQGVGNAAGNAISLLICVSALAAINGQIFTGARIYYAMGRDHPLYAPLGRWSGRRDTPVWSLVIQAVITLAVVIGFGLSGGSSGFEKMVWFTTPVFWAFLTLVGVGLFVLRRREPDAPRPYRVPLYPVVPLLFCASTLFMTYKGVDWALQNKGPEGLWAILAIAAGLVVSLWNRRRAGD